MKQRCLTLIFALFAGAVACAKEEENGNAEPDRQTAMSASKTAQRGSLPQEGAPAPDSARALNVSTQNNSGDGHKLQIGPWTPAAFSLEEPYINIIHASEMWWEAGDMKTFDLIAAGHIDADTGLPFSIPQGANSLESKVFFSARDKRDYHGEWVLDWEGDADIEMLYLTRENQWRENANRLEFTRDRKTPDHSLIKITRLGPGGLTSLRLYRKENETALNSGKIFSPRFIELVARNHIVRTMDLQEANRAQIRSIDEVATMDTLFWGNTAWQSELDQMPARRSAPIEAMLRLGVEADTEIWFHGPMQLGATFNVRQPDIAGNLRRYRDAARVEGNPILDSNEWDRYADAFVDALIKSEYPSDRPLYTTLDNEVWNFAARYLASNHYAIGIGQSAVGGEYPYREGYGILLARWVSAIEAALSRADREQNIIYVAESHTANPDTSRIILKAFREKYEALDGDWSALRGKTGIAITTYWGGNCWYKDIFPSLAPKSQWPYTDAELSALHDKFAEEARARPTELTRRLADCNIGGSVETIGTLPWILKHWRGHADIAEEFGVALLGAYEGGSHDEKPVFFQRKYGAHADALEAFYEEYHWGAEGARVNKAVNDAILAEYPGVILANYATVGGLGQPWFEGGYGAENAMAETWRAYEKQ